ncbi:uncharacterized protein LOC128186674 [Crassostrea angulata]|uniref:uncharacterized protein LOC128186674 n=1 Tax=Magallana angulata TaxID=2784310 RepID=UPI0022B1E324|nr:uncharacterized protein LOC128186674 [Crassostrea angulata]
MKLSLLLVLFVITWCLIDESESAWRRRRFRRVIRRVARRFVSRVVGKRSVVSGSYSLPCDFAAWDKNADGYVDLEEFSSVAYPFVKEGDLEPAFRSMDKDENQQISKTELHKADLMFGIC